MDFMRDRLRNLNGFSYFLVVWASAMLGAFAGTSRGEAWAGGTMHWTGSVLMAKVVGPGCFLAASATAVHNRRARRRGVCGTQR